MISAYLRELGFVNNRIHRTTPHSSIIEFKNKLATKLMCRGDILKKLGGVDEKSGGYKREKKDKIG